jgi:hypothetical protein
MTVESMASPGALKRRLVLDSDAPDALGRKKGGNRRRESNASARGAHRNEKLPRALPSSRALLPRVLPSAPARCPLPVRSSSACAAFCSRVLPSSRALFSHARFLLLLRAALVPCALLCALPSALNRAPSSLVRQLPPLLVDGKRRRILLVDGKRILLALCSRTTLLLCSRTTLLLCSSQLCLALES